MNQHNSAKVLGKVYILIQSWAGSLVCLFVREFAY